MCVLNESHDILIAEEDIIAFKVVKAQKPGFWGTLTGKKPYYLPEFAVFGFGGWHMFAHSGHYRSPTIFRYEIGETYTSRFGKFLTPGFFMYNTAEAAFVNANVRKKEEAVLKVRIPKGTPYRRQNPYISAETMEILAEVEEIFP